MRIAVAAKWAPDPKDASVAPDGSVDWSRARPAVSDYDAVAFVVGRLLADALGAELVGVSVGAADLGTPFARKALLARGLDRLVIVADDRLAGADALTTGRALAALVRHVGAVELVLAGEASVDEGAQLVPSVLAADLGWPVLSGVGSVSGCPGALLVERRTYAARETVRCGRPVVLSLASDAATVGVPGMRDVLAAGRKPSEAVELDALGVRLSAPQMVGRARPAERPRRRVMIDGSDADAAASSLVSALRGAGVLS